MRPQVNRSDVKFYPDPTRTILRFFGLGDERMSQLIGRVMKMSPVLVDNYLNLILNKFAVRHRNVTRTFSQHFENIKHLVPKNAKLSHNQKLLIGSYFTMEYSFESAAFFNPSIVAAPDQYGLVEGQKRIIMSFRAIGEGHISSIVFRMGVVDSRTGAFKFSPIGDRIEEAQHVKQFKYDKKEFQAKLHEMKVSPKLSGLVLKQLGGDFFYPDLRRAVDEALSANNLPEEQRYQIEEIKWLADSHYEIKFSQDADISERVIFPVSETERNGVEDARFVMFKDDKGDVKYYATYTAYDGHTILPKMLVTEDFYNFRSKPIHGSGSSNKNLALFPRKINGKYAMLARIDGVNNYLMYSDKLTIWENPVKIQEPKYPWEFVQIGNCGSPLETQKGWLVITHGVGPMRTYCLGASIFDLNDPTREIGRLDEPLLVPRGKEVEGYVPNVVYSCGAMLCHDHVIIPYGMSDYGSSIITVPLEYLMSKILNA